MLVMDRMPHLRKIIKDPAKTATRLIECYLGEFGEEWMIAKIKEEREWAFAREGKPVLTGKKDGHKTVLNWFRMKAEDARKARPKLAGQERGRKLKPETGLDDFLTEERA